ncbi:hypothetical protein ACQ86N_31525 [Puia sp. P3]|uniref:tetratricopeptide repeat protein n=1 Tax=Puia sp. P3 TaxID=3423952 RepID=UPI003D66F490
MRQLLLFTTVLCLAIDGTKAQSPSTADARHLLYYERYDGAATELQSILTTDPGNSEAWWLLTETYLNRHQPAPITIPAPAAEQPTGLCARGFIFLYNHKKDSAASCFSKALTATKEKDPVILLAVAHAHNMSDSGDAHYALELLTKAIKKDKHNPELYVEMGDSYRRLEDGGNAFRAYHDALTEDAKYAKAMYKSGKIFVSQNNSEQYLQYFNDAVAADTSYAPAWYELYYHWYFRDVNKAMDDLKHYTANDDPGIRNDYLVTDMLYSSAKYADAVQKRSSCSASHAGATEPRLYKLIAYSYKELHDSAKALDYMQQYFNKQKDTSFVEKDFETMGDIYASLNHPDSATKYYAQAALLQKDTLQRYAFAKKLADGYKKQKDYANQAIWLGKYYNGNTKATNLDLFNWGLAHYMAKDYPMADSVFAMYETKYPDQDFGYYWRARADVAIDTAMTTGMAIPQYMKLIDICTKDTTNKTNRKHLIESYGYIAAYRANAQKDYEGAIEYFGKLLALDPGNTDAEHYIAILKKNPEKSRSTTTHSTAAGGEWAPNSHKIHPFHHI